MPSCSTSRSRTTSRATTSLSNLVYAASGHDVVLTMVRGKILYAAGKWPTIDLAAVAKELHDYAIPKVFADDPEETAQ